jgi:electron transport complex protein RnfB
MITAPYEELAAALDRLPNGFPRTAGGLEILILKKLFTPEEASLASLLTGTFEPTVAIAGRIGLPEAEARKRLFALAKKGLAWLTKEGTLRFRLAPFVVGFYEAQAATMDHELAHLVEHYFAEGGVAGIMGPQPALHRVVPAQSAVKTEWILPYDDVKSIILSSTSFAVQDCICRKQKDLIAGRACDFPIRNCMSFTTFARPEGPGTISREAALQLLDGAEEIGLVHTVSNIAKGVSYVCNCCGCCCGILQGITRYGIAGSVAAANYLASIDAGQCTGCGICVDRCQVGAISEAGETAVVDPGRCIGCGLCVTGCASDAARLTRKLQSQIVHPPEDFAAWERARLRNRGLGA